MKALIAHMEEWLDDTARKTRAIGQEDPKTEPRIEGMEFAVRELKRYLDSLNKGECLMQMQAKAIHEAVHGPGGLLDQAKEAQAKGTLVDFFTKLLAQLGPILGPLIQALIASLLPKVP